MTTTTSSELFKSYEAYFCKPHGSLVLGNLYEAILAFDDFEDLSALTAKIFELGKRGFADRAQPCSLLTTGSSSGYPRRYPFAQSYQQYWRVALESFLRSRGLKQVYLDCRPQAFPLEAEALALSAPVWRLHPFDHLDFLLQRLDEQAEPVCLVSRPLPLFSLSTDDRCRRELEARADKLAMITNMDFEMCFRRRQDFKIHLNDQMIDWFTGLNFYTCRCGHKHILPLFHFEGGRCQNLLNTADWSMPLCDDHFRLLGVVPCDCGVRRAEFEFISHAKNDLRIDRGLLDRLDRSYYNLQFLETHDGIEVFYSCREGDLGSDERLIRSAIEGPLKFRKNLFFTIGTKSYNFWKTAPGGEAYVSRGYLMTAESKRRIAGISML